MDRVKLLSLCVGLFVVVSGTFLTSIHNEFTSYDDPIYVTSNFHVQDGLTWKGVKWAFITNAASNWHPLTWLSHMLDCELFGLEPWGHHLMSVLLHAASTGLLFLALRRMTGSVWRSLFVAALFGLHPLRVESVAWISERKDVLSTLFWMLTLWAYARFAEQSKVQGPRSKVFYGLALTFFALGLLSKPMVVTLPFVLLLLDYWPLESWKFKSIQRLVTEKIPFFLVAAAASAVTFLVQKHTGAMQVELPLGGRLENAVVSYCRYIGNHLLPINLYAPYLRPEHWPMTTVIVSATLLLCISIVVLLRCRRQPYLPVGWFWFLGTLVPVIGLVQVGDQAMADRYTYIPLIGITLICTWGLYEWTKRWRLQGVILGAFGAAALVACIPLTHVQIGYWKNSETLFGRAVMLDENNYLAHTGLGLALQERGLLDEAIEEHLLALHLRPAHALSRYNLAIALDKKGRYDEAIEEFLEALRSNPPNAADIHNNLGLTLSRKGLVDEAMSHFQEAIKLNPDNFSPYYNMGYVLSKMKRFAEAIPYFEHALEAKPNDSQAHNYLGVALGRCGRQNDSVTHLQEAVKLDPRSPDIRYNLGNALARNGRLDEAIVQFKETIKLESTSADAHNNLGVLLTSQRQLEEAIFHFQEAVRLNPDFSEAHTNLAAAQKSKNLLPQ